MREVLTIFQILNIATLIVCIGIGLNKFKKLNQNRILILLPIFSIFQILISEIGFGFIYEQYHVNEISKISVDLYSFIEFAILLLFFNQISKNVKLRNLNKIIIIIACLYYYVYMFHFYSNYIFMDYFVLLSGLWIEIVSLTHLLYTIKNYELNQLIRNSNSIVTLGIFLSYIIIWPINVLQSLYINYISSYFEFVFISNSLGYYILFSSLILSFYATGKSGIN